MNMIKLLLLVMMFAFGTSTVNAEENTTRTEDRISELAEINSDSQSTIEDKVDVLSEDELETIISNVDELTEPTEEDLAIKEAAISKLEEIESVETSNTLTIGIGVVGLILIISALVMLFMGYSDQITSPLIIIGLVLTIVMQLLTK